MARPTKELIDALHETIARVADGANYQWGNMGACNCGHLVQSLTKLDRATIHAAALQRAGDWGQQAVDYCSTSGYPLDHIISTVLDAGMTLADIEHLERLNGPEVLQRLPRERRWLKRNSREDLLLYLQTWVALLEEQLASLPTPLPIEKKQRGVSEASEDSQIKQAG
jgi:hypothetical protein